MGNMSYCRFRNTLGDLDDCYEALMEAGSLENFLNDPDNSEAECRSARKLISLCEKITEGFGVEV